MIINEIFIGIDGEVNEYHQGHLTTFVRLAGCNLQCSYCDTQYAQRKDQGKEMSTEMIKNEIYKLGLSKITFTGGEPLLQYDELTNLIFKIQVDAFINKITIETNGSIKVLGSYLRPFVSWVVDWKLPSSGMSYKMNIENFSGLSNKDWVKFVVGDLNDYEEAKKMMRNIRTYEAPEVNFAISPVFGDKLEIKELVDWMLTDRLRDVILNVQIHKLIGLK